MNKRDSFEIQPENLYRRVILILSSSRKQHFSHFRFPTERVQYLPIPERSKKLGRENARKSAKRQCRALNLGLLMLHPYYWVAFQRRWRSIEHEASINLSPSSNPSYSFLIFGIFPTTIFSRGIKLSLNTEYLPSDLSHLELLPTNPLVSIKIISI